MAFQPLLEIGVHDRLGNLVRGTTSGPRVDEADVRKENLERTRSLCQTESGLVWRSDGTRSVSRGSLCCSHVQGGWVRRSGCCCARGEVGDG